MKLPTRRSVAALIGGLIGLGFAVFVSSCDDAVVPCVDGIDIIVRGSSHSAVNRLETHATVEGFSTISLMCTDEQPMGLSNGSVDLTCERVVGATAELNLSLSVKPPLPSQIALDIRHPDHPDEAVNVKLPLDWSGDECRGASVEVELPY